MVMREGFIMKCIILKRKILAAAGCLAVAAAMFVTVNHPAVVGVAASERELPIYCVERDQKMLSISCDAAWGDGRERRLEHKGVPGAALFTQKSRTG